MDAPWLLAGDEMALVQNAQWLLTKQQVIEKVYLLFGRLSQHYSTLLHPSPLLTPEIRALSPKISRGEYYRQLPYVVLDQPRFFTQTDAFAIRSFFWWGNSFSLQLQVSGKYKTLCMPVLQQQLTAGNLQNWHTVLHADPWQHHFGPDNYVPAAAAPVTDILAAWQQHPFIKLGLPLPLQHWPQAYDFYTQGYQQLLLLLNTA